MAEGPEDTTITAEKKGDAVGDQPKQPRKRATKPIAEDSVQEKAVGTVNEDSDTLLFGKYAIKGVNVSDQSIANYVRFTMQPYPNIAGRRKFHAYYNSHISIVERLVNKLMRGGTGRKIGGKVIRTSGRLQGKKLKVMHIVQRAFGIINRKSGKNPVQVLVDALQNSAPIEDTTRVRYGGISYNVAVGISSNRRVDVAIRNMALAALIGSFKKKRRLAEALADELLLASQNSPDSYAIKKRIESERIARRAR